VAGEEFHPVLTREDRGGEEFHPVLTRDGPGGPGNHFVFGGCKRLSVLLPSDHGALRKDCSSSRSRGWGREGGVQLSSPL
jgi:hypothetical protein